MTDSVKIAVQLFIGLHNISHRDEGEHQVAESSSNYWKNEYVERTHGGDIRLSIGRNVGDKCSSGINQMHQAAVS